MFEEHLKALGIKSPVQRKAVEILGGLHGYSKRKDLLTDQLRKELSRVGVGAGRIDPLLTELNQLGLVKEKQGTEGVRLSLNRDVWDLPPNVIVFVFKATEHFANEMRADTRFSGVLKAVRSTIRKTGRLQEDIGQTVFKVLVTCALRRHPEWDVVNGQAARKSDQNAINTNISNSVQLTLPGASQTSVKAPRVTTTAHSETTKKVQRVVEVSPSVVPVVSDLLPRNIDFVHVAMDSLFPVSLVEAFGPTSIRFFGETAKIKVPLSLGRGQWVYVALRRNAVHEQVFWLFSICGLGDPVQKIIKDIVWHNNECGPFKVTFLDMPTGMHIGVCHTMTTDSDWERQLPGVVRNLAAFADRLEQLYWSQDEF